MDRFVKARFYQIEALEENACSFHDCLLDLWARPDRTAYHDLGHGAHIRIERCAADPQNPDFIAGEFVRQQVDNIPPVAPAGAPLAGNANPLGHRCAFRFHKPTNILLLESRREAITAGRTVAFVKAKMRGHRGFNVTPCLSEGALDRLREGTPRKITMRVARPSELYAEAPDNSLAENLAGLQEFFRGPSIEISSGWPRGNRDGVLKNVLDAVRYGTANRANVKKISVKLDEDKYPIDVFSEQMMIENLLDLDSENVERNYTERAAFLHAGFRTNLAVIVRLYGPGN